MNFLAPIAFWFAISLPVVIAIYLLKRRRKSKLVSSSLLWTRYLEESQANAPFQRLKKSWLMWLQLLLLLLVVLALARPSLTGSTKSTRLRVIVLDASASMQSTDVLPSRFEVAKKQAAEWIDGLQGDAQCMILWAGPTVEVRQSPTRNKASLHQALDQCQPSEGRTEVVDALRTASAFTFEKRGEATTVSGEIHLFSDGAIPGLAELADKNLPITYHRVGVHGQNIGIVALEARSNPDDPQDRAVLASVRNSGTNSVTVHVQFLFNDAIQDVRALDLAPTNKTSVVFRSRQSGDGIFGVRLLETDALSADNQAFVWSSMPEPVQVLLVSPGNRLLEKGLRSSPRVRLTTMTSLPQTTAGFDVVVLDNVMPAVWPDANVLAFRVFPPAWFEDPRPQSNPMILDWNHSHPALRFVQMDNVDVMEAVLPKTPLWGQALIQSQDRPLAVAGEKDRNRVIWIGFDVLQSNWPLRLSFPIFLANAVDWLNPVTSKAGERTVRTGEPLRYSLRHPVEKAELQEPSGRKATIAAEPGGRGFLWGATYHTGVYHLDAGTNHAAFCVNLLDAKESDITPQDELGIGKYAGIAATKDQRASREIWRWLLALGWLVLQVEWWFYHKRTA